MSSEKEQVSASSPAQDGDGLTELNPPEGSPKDGEKKGLIDVIPYIPPGLEPIAPLKEMFFSQRKQDGGSEGKTRTRYSVYDMSGKIVYVGDEDTNPLVRKMGGRTRQLKVNLTDPDDPSRTLISIERGSLSTGSSALPKLMVSNGEGEVYGMICQKRNCFSTKFEVLNHKEELLYVILAPKCTCRCCGPAKFLVKKSETMKDNEALISKHWNGMVKDISIEDNLSIYFPDDADPTTKALLIAASILIDVMHFKRTQKIVKKAVPPT